MRSQVARLNISAAKEGDEKALLARKSVPQLFSRIDSTALTARLKSCPCDEHDFFIAL